MNKSARAAATSTGFSNFKEKVTPDTKRYAGALLAAIFAPSLAGALDNQETTIGSNIASGAMTVLGTGVGGYMGYRQGNLSSEELKDEFTRNAVNDIKVKSQQVAKTEGPAAAIEYFAREKDALLQTISGIDPKRAEAFNSTLRQVPEFGEMVADLDLLRKTPREVRGMTRGAALGAVAAAVPAYLALRDGEITE